MKNRLKKTLRSLTYKAIIWISWCLLLEGEKVNVSFTRNEIKKGMKKNAKIY